MLIRGKQLKTALILGAGATRGAIGHVLVNRKHLKPPLNGDFFHVAKTLARARGTSSPVAKRVDRLLRLFKNELPTRGTPPMEAAFSLLYTAKDFPEIYKSGPGRKPSPGERRELEDFLRLLFEILALLDAKGGTQTGYDRLASVLRPADTIITLNYDTALDSALCRHGWNPKIGYGLTGSTSKVKWSLAPSSFEGNRSANGVRLLKLHGSSNWWVRGSFSNLARLFSSKPVLVSPPRRNERKKLIRQIIPPIYGKTFAHAHWRGLWNAAFNALCDAEALVVVGCSIVDTDFHLQALIRRVARCRKDGVSQFKTAVFVDRVPIRRRWKRMFRTLIPVRLEFKTFESFLSQGIKV